MWRLSGIFRDVTLWAAPAIHIQDFQLWADFEYEDTATFRAMVLIEGQDKTAAQAFSLQVSVLDVSGEPVCQTIHLFDITIPRPSGNHCRIVGETWVPEPHLWSAE